MDSSVKSVPDHYATLGVGPEASDREVEQAFHARVLEHLQHPNAAEESGRQKARQVSLAYETLRDPSKRRAYDASRPAVSDPEEVSSGAGHIAGEGPILFGGAAAAGARATPAPAAPPLPEPDERSAAPIVDSDSAEALDAAPQEPEVADVAHPEPIDDPVESEPVDAVEAPVAPDAAYAAEAPPVEAPVAPDAAHAAEAEPVEEAMESDAVAAEPEAAYAADPELVDAPVAAAAAAEAGAADETFEPAGGRYIMEREPRDNLPADRRAYDAPPRSIDKQRAVLGAGAAVIALGVAGLFLTRGGSGSEQTAGNRPAQVTVPAGTARPVATENVANGAAPTAPLPADNVDVADSEGSATASVRLPPAPSGDRLSSLTIPPASSTTVAATSTSGTASRASAPAGSSPADKSPASPAAASATPPASAQADAAQPVPTPAPPVKRGGTLAHYVSGGLTNDDNPAGMYQGTVTVRFTVQPNGRVSDCRPVASSGNGGLDASTCALVQQRLRFSPALDADGQPVPSEVRTTYSWGRTRHR